MDNNLISEYYLVCVGVDTALHLARAFGLSACRVKSRDYTITATFTLVGKIAITPLVR